MSAIVKMKQRRGTAVAWTSANPVLSAGEIGFETDTNKFKIGNGVTTWDSLNYFVDLDYIYPGLNFGLQDISAGVQESDITIYESGGVSEKKDGFILHLSWTGGTGAFAHTIDAAYTIGNQMSGFLADTAWQGDGAGELVLRLDKTNSKWLVLIPGIWDSGTFTNAHFEKHINKTMMCREQDTTTLTTSVARGNVWGSAAFAITFPIAFIGTVPQVTTTPNRTNNSPVWAASVLTATLTTANMSLMSSVSNAQGTIGYIAYGLWA